MNVCESFQIYLLIIHILSIRMESFTSTTHLTHLFNTEIELVQQLESYLHDEYERLDRVEK